MAVSIHRIKVTTQSLGGCQHWLGRAVRFQWGTEPCLSHWCRVIWSVAHILQACHVPWGPSRSGYGAPCQTPPPGLGRCWGWVCCFLDVVSWGGLCAWHCLSHILLQTHTGYDWQSWCFYDGQGSVQISSLHGVEGIYGDSTYSHAHLPSLPDWGSAASRRGFKCYSLLNYLVEHCHKQFHSVLSKELPYFIWDVIWTCCLSILQYSDYCFSWLETKTGHLVKQECGGIFLLLIFKSSFHCCRIADGSWRSCWLSSFIFLI